MNQEQFVELLKKSIIKEAVDDNISLFKNPPGRKPDKLLLDASAFYEKLSESEKEVFKACLLFQSESVVFNLLTMLDGVNRFSEDENAMFELNVVENGVKSHLNDPNKEFLHDLLKAN